jgi:hypothetical protein
MKRSPMKPTRRPIRARSAKAVARDEARRACVAAVIARDRVCQFPVLLELYEAQCGFEVPLKQEDRCCRGALVAHEPKHRRNVDPTDPANCIAMCPWHNGLVETMGALGYDIGVLERGNGEPYRRRG